jgi:hypothetical protein
MGNRNIPAGRSRVLRALVAFLVVSSLVQFQATEFVGAADGDAGPALIPGTNTFWLQGENFQWDTKNQHRIWRNGSRWDAVVPTSTGWQIAQDVASAPGVSPTYGPAITGTNAAASRQRPDVYWDGTDLFVLMSGSNPAMVYRFTYSGGNYILQSAAPISGFGTAASRGSIYQTPISGPR